MRNKGYGLYEDSLRGSATSSEQSVYPRVFSPSIILSMSGILSIIS